MIGEKGGFEGDRREGGFEDDRRKGRGGGGRGSL